MKTSNKLLAAAVLLLVTAAVVNALTLKSRFKAIIAAAPTEFQNFTAADFHSVELSGSAPLGIGGRLHVTVKYADHFNVRHSALDFIHIEQVGPLLRITVDHPKGYMTDMKRTPEIIIECPDLLALTALGTPLDSIDLPADAHLYTRRHYQKGEVTVEGFRGTALDIFAAEGMEVTLNDLTVDSLTARAGSAGKVKIHRNEIGNASLTVGDDAAITLEESKIGTVATDVAEKGQFIVIGTQLTARSARSVD